MANRVTIADIAKAAGVSTATVSYILNNNPKQSISQATRERVLQIASDLNYRSNDAARSLQSQRANCICIAVDGDQIGNRHVQIIQSALSTFAKEGVQATISTEPIDNKDTPYYMNQYQSGRVDGIFFIGLHGRPLDRKLETTIVERRIPFVSHDCETGKYINSVELDYLGGAYDIANHLIKQGVSRIQYLRPGVDTRQEREREQGLRMAAFEHKVPVDVHELQKGWTTGDLVSQLQALIENIATDTALILSWSGFVEAALQLRTKLGRDFPIAALANAQHSPLFNDKLYYSYIPTAKIGHHCARILLNLIKDPNYLEHELLRPTLDPPDESIFGDY